jgi:quinol monooxygenase YgiN
MFVAAWEFRAAPAAVAAFAAAYGPDGEWVRLMRGAPGYLGTETLQDRDDPLRFLVLDRWADEAALRAFRTREAARYDELDARCLSLTERESKLGRFRSWDGAPPAAAP